MIHSNITFKGKNIHFQDEGRENNKVLVLLHGFMNNLEIWASYIYSYMNNMRVIAIDLPGHGNSATYGEIHTMEFMADAVHAVLENLGIEQCVILGHSMGGYVTLAFAEKYPYMLRGFGLLNSQAIADEPDVVQKRYESIELAKTNRPDYIIKFIPELFYSKKRNQYSVDIKDVQDLSLETTVDGIAAAQRGMAQRTTRLSVLEDSQVPVLFIYGKEDPRIPVEYAVCQAVLPKYSEIMLLGEVSHMSFLEERDFVKQRIKNFVNTCYL